jgi:cell division protein FtsQ
MAKLRGQSKGNTRTEPGSAEGFWDRPMLINLLADVLLLAGGVLLAWAGVVALQRMPVFPLNQLVVTAPLDQVSRAQVEHTARSALAGNFFTVNLDAAQAAFERMPWVRSASLRRLWPDGVLLELEEHRAAARWTPLDGEARLVSTRGEVFLAGTREALPAFAGPEGSAPRVLSRYQEFSENLGFDRAQAGRHQPLGTRSLAIETGRRRGPGIGPRPAQAPAGRTPGPLHDPLPRREQRGA